MSGLTVVHPVSLNKSCKKNMGKYFKLQQTVHLLLLISISCLYMLGRSRHAWHASFSIRLMGMGYAVVSSIDRSKQVQCDQADLKALDLSVLWPYEIFTCSKYSSLVLYVINFVDCVHNNYGSVYHQCFVL
jgi:hypothetical protein